MVGLLHAMALWFFWLLAESYETINHYHYREKLLVVAVLQFAMFSPNLSSTEKCRCVGCGNWTV